MSSSVTLMPHAVCWAAAPKLVWTMVVTNFITFLSYSTICFTLLLLARRTRRVIARDWAYFVIGFALFIVACGSTHLLEVITTWSPIFWVDACTNIITALPHPHKPLLRNRLQLDRAIRQPDVHSWIPFYASGEPKDVGPTDQPAEVERNATTSKWANNRSG